MYMLAYCMNNICTCTSMHLHVHLHVALTQWNTNPKYLDGASSTAHGPHLRRSDAGVQTLSPNGWRERSL
jgi:hypothetical protein